LLNVINPYQQLPKPALRETRTTKEPKLKDAKTTKVRKIPPRLCDLCAREKSLIVSFMMVFLPQGNPLLLCDLRARKKRGWLSQTNLFFNPNLA